MGKWKEYKLGELVEITNGFAFKSEKFLSIKTDDSLPVIKIKNVANGDVHLNDCLFYKYDESLKKYIINKNDILIALTGNHPEVMTQVVGETSRYKLELKALLNQRVAKIEAKKNLDNDFLYYFLKDDSTHDYLASQSAGSANQANISKGNIEDLPIICPSISEQFAIASILSSLDDKIDLLNRQNKTLEALAETLFRQWFVEEADESWEEVKLKTLCAIITKGTTPTTFGKQFVSSGINFLKVESLTEDGEFIESKFAHIDLETDKLLSRSRIKTNDVLITIAGTIGRVAIVPERILPANTNQAIAIIRVNSEILDPVLIYLLLKSPIVINDFESRVVHAVQPNLSLGEIGDIGLRLPPKESVIKFSNEINLVFNKKEKNNIQIRTITQLRDTLLPKLMSGEVRVRL